MLLAPSTALARGVEHHLATTLEEFVQAVELAVRVREQSQGAHQLVKEAAILPVERLQHGNDRVPCVFTSRRDVITANLPGELIPHVSRFDPLAVTRLVRGERRNIHHAHMVRKAGDQLLERHLRELLGCEIGTGFHEDLDPDTKALGIESFVEPGPCRPPQVEVEDL